MTPPLADSFQTLTDGQGPLAVAVSGGGDSMAVLHLAARHCGRPLQVVTVDHGLRDVRAELDLVARAAQDLGVAHTVLRWHWDGQGSLQAQARAARKDLISDWAQSQGINQILLGHTRDDQAETVLLRLARGSGVDGLAAMRARSVSHGMTWLRPVLDHARADLRDWLRANGIGWADDPSNDDPRFDRVRARQMMSQLADLGLSTDRLVQTADHARAAHISLQRAARDWVARHSSQTLGCLRLDPRVLDLDCDTHRRVFAGAVQWAGRGSYRPAWAPLRAAAGALADGQAATLGGAHMIRAGDDVVILRERAKVPTGAWQGPSTAWDGWQIHGPHLDDAHIAPVGDALAAYPDWRSLRLPHPAAQVLPAIWAKGEVIALPAIDRGPWTARIVADFASFFDCR